MFNSPFQDNRQKINVDEIDYVIISDHFADQYLGGAELTTEAILEKAPGKFMKINSKDVNEEIIKALNEKVWIFGNFSTINYNLIPQIIGTLKYFVVEFDYKYCSYRSPEKHKFAVGNECDCFDNNMGKIVSAFYYGAEGLFWMSKDQKDYYMKLFPFLEEKDNVVLSSIFHDNDLDFIKSLRKKERNGKYAIIGSNSWIKGVEESEKLMKEKGLEYEIINNHSYKTLLETLSKYEGLCFVPRGRDTCPRIVIEAKLLGLNLFINENVQHATESWWQGGIDTIESYLRTRADYFWEFVSQKIDEVTISGYTTTYNCIKQKYPFRQSIESMLGFCDEVVIVDGGSSDGTWEVLLELSKNHNKIKILQTNVDWNAKRFAVQDGLQKARARSACTMDFCWQMDCDEVVHEDDYDKVKAVCKRLPKNANLIALPVIEYWGSSEKIRVDINPWKWRLSRNRKFITHGIPAQLRRFDENNEMFAAQGTDGCDYVDSETGVPIQFLSFYDQGAHTVRMRAVGGDDESLEMFEVWFNNVIANLPGVHHYSWIDIERKIKTYKGYWQKHWESLYNIVQEDTPENNKFFGKPWKDVSDEEIKNLSQKLGDEMGGWIFHNKVNFDFKTPYMMIERDEPEVMKNDK